MTKGATDSSVEGDGETTGPGGTRLFVTEPLAAGATVELASAQAHYLRHVLRLEKGAQVALFNGQDGEWSGTIAGFGKSRAAVEVGACRRDQVAEPDLWLLFAPIKRGRIDYLSQKAAELGVSAMQPVMTEYTQVARVNADRLAANAVEAAQQTGRLSVPEVRDPARLFAVLDGWDESRRLMVCDESGGGLPIAEALARVPRVRPDPWAVLIGPEGGFAPRELDGLRKLPFVTPVSLGPRLLRADTAAVAALSCWQAVRGDWTDAIPGR